MPSLAKENAVDAQTKTALIPVLIKKQLMWWILNILIFLGNKNSRSLLNFGTNRYISPLESHLLLPFMKKCLLLASIALFLMPFGLRAQNSFDLETDTVCVGQLI